MGDILSIKQEEDTGILTAFSLQDIVGLLRLVTSF
jgi:hypothetical protein